MIKTAVNNLRDENKFEIYKSVQLHRPHICLVIGSVIEIELAL